MPDRIIRAKILTSDLINQLSWPAEIFYRRLMSVADDFGRYDARPAILRGSLYPLKLDKVSDADVVKWLGECSKAGLVSVYQVDGKDYLEILKFGQRLRIQKSQYPPPAEGKQLPAAGIGGHLTTSADNCCQMLQEEKRREVVVETEEKEKDSALEYAIEECLTIALRDPRWVKANGTTQKELEQFNLLLTKRGHYKKNPADYKSHFANWKNAGKIDSAVTHMPYIGNQTLEQL